MTIAQSKNCFRYIQERSDEFLALFPHRFDYIWAEHPSPDASVEWRTETRHPLSDRLIQQGAYLYGVRFGAETNYCLLDVDADSIYHPDQDSLAISQIAAALEPLGLVRHFSCTSSYSGGLHLYFPFQHAQSSWQLAIAVACLLENAGFKLQPGQLEIFPNPKPYSANGNLSLFNAHRLPLQIGSYLLDEEFQPIWSDTHTFVKQWILLQEHNDINSKTLKQILKQAKRRHFSISGKAEKFVNDLNAEIELGWTGFGQTNRLLGRIAMRAYIFHHILSGVEPLKGQKLVSKIVETAQSLPGYREWCRHQHEIEHRAEEWARCIENSRYFHFGDQHKKPKSEVQDLELTAAIDQAPSWNQRQAVATRDRIRRAIADLLETNSLPARPTARFQALLEYSIGGASLYRYRDLWHPNYFDIDSAQNLPDVLESNALEQPVENPPHPPVINSDSQLDGVEGASNWLSPTSLLSATGSNVPSDKASSDLTHSNVSTNASNSSTDAEADFSATDPLEGVQYVQQALFNIRASQEAFQEAARLAQSQHQRIKSEAAQQRQIARMQQFLGSGDPILIAEAMAWAQVNPGVLQVNNLQSLLAGSSTRQSLDRSSILAAIAAQLGQLGWSDEQVELAFQQNFGKCNLAMLSDSELMQWLEWLGDTTPLKLSRSLD